MSQFQPKPNTGVLFKNDKKETDSHPDYTGRIADENGRERFLSAWINETKDGNRKYLKLSKGKYCDEAHQQGVEQASQAGGFSGPADDFDDDLPPF